MSDPRPIRDVLTELMNRRGFARIQNRRSRDAAWREVVGPVLAEHSRLGNARRGTLEITVSNPVIAQEMTYQKTEILTRLQELLPEESIRDLRFKSGRLS